MKTIALRNLGRFGNQLFRYAYARALAEQNGYMLKTERWVGEKIFTLGGPNNLIPWPEPDGTEDIVIDGYHQCQDSLIYSQADCRRWFEIKPEIERMLEWGHEPSNWRAARVRMPATSEPTPGSDIENAPRTSPVAIRGR